MISDGKSRYKSWSDLRKRMDGLLCEALKGRITYFFTRYHGVRNVYGRAAVRCDGEEWVSFSWAEGSEQMRDRAALYEEMGAKPRNWAESLRFYRLVSERGEREKWMPGCVLCENDFLDSVTAYLQTEVAAALASDNYILRLFAFLDRRVGKRMLLKIRDEAEALPEWVKKFYRLRCEAEGLSAVSAEPAPGGEREGGLAAEEVPGKKGNGKMKERRPGGAR